MMVDLSTLSQETIERVNTAAFNVLIAPQRAIIKHLGSDKPLAAFTDPENCAAAQALWLTLDQQQDALEAWMQANNCPIPGTGGGE